MHMDQAQYANILESEQRQHNQKLEAIISDDEAVVYKKRDNPMMF